MLQVDNLYVWLLRISGHISWFLTILSLRRCNGGEKGCFILRQFSHRWLEGAHFFFVLQSLSVFKFVGNASSGEWIHLVGTDICVKELKFLSFVAGVWGMRGEEGVVHIVQTGKVVREMAALADLVVSGRHIIDSQDWLAAIIIVLPLVYEFREGNQFNLLLLGLANAALIEDPRRILLLLLLLRLALGLQVGQEWITFQTFNLLQACCFFQIFTF